ncbi:unnamed protein product [Symbiodinium microadriaticum]|nr:unnamed protein product [Symbiodinium microadriaticum]
MQDRATLDEDPYGFFARVSDDATVHYSAPASPASPHSCPPASPLLPSDFHEAFEELPGPEGTALPDDKLGRSCEVVPIATPLRNLSSMVWDCQAETVPDELFNGGAGCFALISSMSDCGTASEASASVVASAAAASVVSASALPDAANHDLASSAASHPMIPATAVIPSNVSASCAAIQDASSAALCPVIPNDMSAASGPAVHDATSAASCPVSDVVSSLPNHDISSAASCAVMPASDVCAAAVPNNSAPVEDASSTASLPSVIPRDVSAKAPPMDNASSAASLPAVIPSDVSASAPPKDNGNSAASLPAVIPSDVSASAPPVDNGSSAASLPAVIPSDVSASAPPVDNASSAASFSAVIPGDVSASAPPMDDASSAASLPAEIHSDVSASAPALDNGSSAASLPTAIPLGSDVSASAAPIDYASSVSCAPRSDNASSEASPAVPAASAPASLPAYQDTVVCQPVAPHVNEDPSKLQGPTDTSASFAKPPKRSGSTVNGDLWPKIERLKALKAQIAEKRAARILAAKAQQPDAAQQGVDPSVTDTLQYDASQAAEAFSAASADAKLPEAVLDRKKQFEIDETRCIVGRRGRGRGRGKAQHVNKKPAARGGRGRGRGTEPGFRLQGKQAPGAKRKLEAIGEDAEAAEDSAGEDEGSGEEPTQAVEKSAGADEEQKDSGEAASLAADVRRGKGGKGKGKRKAVEPKDKEEDANRAADVLKGKRGKGKGKGKGSKKAVQEEPGKEEKNDNEGKKQAAKPPMSASAKAKARAKPKAKAKAAGKSNLESEQKPKAGGKSNLESEQKIAIEGPAQYAFWARVKPLFAGKKLGPEELMKVAASQVDPFLKAFVAILLMLSWMDVEPPFGGRAVDLVELFAGKGRITSVLLVLLAHVLGNTWIIEQPSSSLFYLHTRFQWLLRVCLPWEIPAARLTSSISRTLYRSTDTNREHSLQAEVYKVALWLRKYGHEMPKRTLLYSNNPLICVFKTGKLFKQERGNHNGMYYRYNDKKNRKRVTGTAKLKNSQCYPVKFARAMVDMMPLFREGPALKQPPMQDDNDFLRAFAAYPWERWPESALEECMIYLRCSSLVSELFSELMADGRDGNAIYLSSDSEGCSSHNAKSTGHSPVAAPAAVPQLATAPQLAAPDQFCRRYRVETKQDTEREVSIPFEYLSEAEMAEHPYNMEPTDINKIVQRAKSNPAKFMRWHTFKSDTLTYFVEKKVEGEMSNPARMSNWDSEEIQKEAVKVLKKLGFPSSEGPANAGTNLPKILACLSRRSEKITETQDELAEHRKVLLGKGKLTTTVDRMDAKLTEMFNNLETKSAQVEDLHMSGVVEGYDSSPDLIRLQYESIVKECQRSRVSLRGPALGTLFSAILQWHRAKLVRASMEVRICSASFFKQLLHGLGAREEVILESLVDIQERPNQGGFPALGTHRSPSPTGLKGV